MLHLNRSRAEKTNRVAVGEWQAELLPANAYQAHYIATNSVIGFAFDGQTGAHAYATDRIRPFRAQPDSLAFVPKGCDVFSESQRGGEYLCLLFKATNTGATDAGLERFENRFSNVFDARAVCSAHALRRMIICPDFADPILIESHARSLAQSVGRYFSVKPAPANKRVYLTEARLRLVDELIEEHLSEGLSIGFLADSLGLSTGYFSRVFRASTGKTPFDYVIDRRVSRARQLIQEADTELSLIASACGFSSHAHMTETFRRRLGLSPSQFRECVK